MNEKNGVKMRKETSESGGIAHRKGKYYARMVTWLVFEKALLKLCACVAHENHV